MKTIRIAIVVLLLLTVTVVANSLYISHVTEKFSRELENLDINSDNIIEELESGFKRFKKAERFISITVSHDDLTNIEESFADIIGAAKAGETGDIQRIKSRLVDSLLHLGRLSSLNLDSII